MNAQDTLTQKLNNAAGIPTVWEFLVKIMKNYFDKYKRELSQDSATKSSWKKTQQQRRRGNISGATLTSDYTEPGFMSPINNITVAIGKEAVFTCTVSKLGKIIWIKDLLFL